MLVRVLYLPSKMANVMYVCLLSMAIATCVYCQEEGERKLKIEYIVKVDGDCKRKTQKHDLVTIHYSGYLENGTKFDSSVERNEPYQFQLGIGEVITGWEEGLLDMCPGEKRKLTIPPNLAYGDQVSSDSIPPGSTLVFDVELVHTADGPVPPNVFKDIDTDKDLVLTPDEVSAYLIVQARTHGQEVDPSSEYHKSVVQTIFDDADKDRDGVISHNEFSDQNMMNYKGR